MKTMVWPPHIYSDMLEEILKVSACDWYKNKKNIAYTKNLVICSLGKRGFCQLENKNISNKNI